MAPPWMVDRKPATTGRGTVSQVGAEASGGVLFLLLRPHRRRADSPPNAHPFRAEPRAYVITAPILVALTAVFALATVGVSRPSTHHIVVGAVVTVVAIVCEEAMSWASRVRLRLRGHVHQDMLAVWIIAVTLALPTAVGVVAVAAIELYSWGRNQRSSPVPGHRAIVNTSNTLLTCLATGSVFHPLAGAVGAGLWSPWALVLVPVALVVYTVVNRAGAAIVLRTLRRPMRAVLLDRDENFIELATLSLGALAALAVMNQPLLVVFVLPPMITIQRAAAMRELEAAATTDAKTGLLNAVAWEQIAARELARAEREESSVAVLVIDIDHFKRVNDRFGHLAGDTVLRQVGRLLTAEVREYDTVARFGGEEFVAVLPDADADAALAVAERLRARVNQLWLSQVVDVTAAEQDEPLAVSIGVTTVSGGGVELHQLLVEADAALYRAKDEGRNRVVLATPPQGERASV